jgi:hypothetical protein
MARDFGSKNKAPSEKAVKKGVQSALDAMIGRPISVSEDNPTSSAERVALLLNRIQELKAQSGPNKFQSSFEEFLFELVRTKDEAILRVTNLPRDPYIYEQIDAYFKCPLLLVEKSRRVRASWITCAFDIWIAAGGQDPRWPILMNSPDNRQVILASRKLENLQGSQWFLEKRIKFILDELEKNNIREHWPSFPKWEWTANEVEWSNGSFITAIASGKDQARGPGATLVHAEEAAFWPEAQSSIEGMIPVLHGGGHLILVTTPQANTYCHRIVQDTLKGREYW